jgi:hypothetical protein
LVSPANAINATLYEKLNFNFIRDIEPIAGVIRGPFVMLVNPSVPATSVSEFIAYAKANPGKINMASAHVAGETFKMMAGVHLFHVPYRGAQVFPALLAGDVHVYFGPRKFWGGSPERPPLEKNKLEEVRQKLQAEIEFLEHLLHSEDAVELVRRTGESETADSRSSSSASAKTGASANAPGVKFDVSADAKIESEALARGNGAPARRNQNASAREGRDARRRASTSKANLPARRGP